MIQVNMRTKAISETTKQYNSMFCCGDKYLGLTDSGIFIMGGTTDNGAQINALIKSGQFDFGVSNEKRFRFFYFIVETEGPLKLTVYADNIQVGQYEFTGKVDGGQQRIRVPVNSRVGGRLWSWELENVGGSPLKLFDVSGLPITQHLGH